MFSVFKNLKMYIDSMFWQQIPKFFRPFDKNNRIRIRKDFRKSQAKKVFLACDSVEVDMV